MVQTVARDDVLHDVDSAITAALRNGASPEDVCRVVDFASGKFRAANGRTSKLLYFNRVLFFGFWLCAVWIATTNIVASTRSSQHYFAATTEETKALNDAPSNNNYRTQMTRIKDLQHSHIDFEKAVLGLQNNQTNHPCPLDSFFHEECEKRDGGTTCIFPDAILKRVDKEYMTQEMNEIAAFLLLNDTRYFPKLYYADEQCQTILMENVRKKGKDENTWCSNFTYYEEFYRSAFQIFKDSNIIPDDLNACCNTIVNGDDIRIIDFGMYVLNADADFVRKRNKEILEAVLEEARVLKKEQTKKCKRES